MTMSMTYENKIAAGDLLLFFMKGNEQFIRENCLEIVRILYKFAIRKFGPAKVDRR